MKQYSRQKVEYRRCSKYICKSRQIYNWKSWKRFFLHVGGRWRPSSRFVDVKFMYLLNLDIYYDIYIYIYNILYGEIYNRNFAWKNEWQTRDSCLPFCARLTFAFRVSTCLYLKFGKVKILKPSHKTIVFTTFLLHLQNFYNCFFCFFIFSQTYLESFI